MHPCSFASILLMAGALAQQTTVVPAAFGTADAPAQLWIAGAAADLRQQILIDAGHLTAVLGQPITAIEFRRNLADEVYLAGACHLAVTLSTVPTPARAVRRQFTANIGANAVQSFAGTVALPLSPNSPSVPPWTVTNIVRIAFSQPFVYTGGTLSIDMVGTTLPGQETGWWMADAAFEALQGSTQQLGAGCGAFGGANAHWSHVDPCSLLPGTEARFEAQGTAGDLAFLFFGAPAAAPLPLWLLGLPGAANCRSQLDPGSLLGSAITSFAPSTAPGFAPSLGIAEVFLPLPAVPSFFGMTFATQWLSLPGFATSNGTGCTVAGGLPTLGMALVQGDPLEPVGEVSVLRAHVVRLEHP